MFNLVREEIAREAAAFARLAAQQTFRTAEEKHRRDAKLKAHLARFVDRNGDQMLLSQAVNAEIAQSAGAGPTECAQ